MLIFVALPIIHFIIKQLTQMIMKTTFTLTILAFSMLFFSNCNNKSISDYNNDTLKANFSGFTEIYTGGDQSITLDSLTMECIYGLNLLYINTIVFKNDTIKWSYYDDESDSKGYLLYKGRLSNDTIYGEYIGFEINGTQLDRDIQDNIYLIERDNGLDLQFYYLKRSYHQQFFSFLPLDPLKNDYINTLESAYDSLKYWKINIHFI